MSGKQMVYAVATGAVLQLICAGYSSLRAEELSASSRVTVIVMDSYGGELPMANIRLSRLGVPIRAQSGVTVDLKPADYEVDVAVTGFNSFHGWARIDQSHQILRVAMPLGQIEGKPLRCSIRGRVSAPDPLLQIRLMSATGTDIRDVPSGSDGSFRFESLECGSYILIALRKAEPVGVVHHIATRQAVPVSLPIQPSLKNSLYDSPGRRQ